MWILTRNRYEVLKKNGNWGYWRHGDPDEWRVFDSFDSAKTHSETETMTNFTRPLSLDRVYEERVTDDINRKSEEISRLTDCQYVALPEPLEFTAAKETYCVPEFQSFMATHYVISGGMVCGVTGYVNDADTCMPFHLFVGGDDYFIEFCEFYRRADGTVSENVEDGDSCCVTEEHGGATCP